MKQNLLGTAGSTFALAVIMIAAVASYGQPVTPVAIPDGYATQNGGTTGGGSATPVIVTTASAFKAVAENDDPAVIFVQGKLNVGTVSIVSNKTIIGVDKNSGLYGGIVRVRGTNDIFQNLVIGPSNSDAMELSGAKNVFIHKCEFVDGADGSLDIVRESDYVTVSWCKFYYVNQTSHRNALMIGNSDKRTSDAGKLHVTIHHPWKDMAGMKNDGQLGWEDLKFDNCSQPTFAPNKFPVFDLPYSFTKDKVDDVKSLVTDRSYGAGNCLTC